MLRTQHVAARHMLSAGKAPAEHTYNNCTEASLHPTVLTCVAPRHALDAYVNATAYVPLMCVRLAHALPSAAVPVCAQSL